MAPAPDNYRGITLLSCLGKLFTSILNNRLTVFLEQNNLLGEEQAGFREHYSTLDHIYTIIMSSLINQTLSKKKRVYCAFIDYRKAFDSVDGISLWSKLLNSGISGKIFTVITNIYGDTKSCVRHNNQLSQLFSYVTGRQPFHGIWIVPVLAFQFYQCSPNDKVNICHCSRNFAKCANILVLLIILHRYKYVCMSMAANYPLYATKTGVLILKYVPFRSSEKTRYAPILHSACSTFSQCPVTSLI